jgi:hypothetical protein
MKLENLELFDPATQEMTGKDSCNDSITAQTKSKNFESQQHTWQQTE